MSGLSLDDLEAVYEHLARAIDAAGPEKEALFLTRLALLLAQELGSARPVHKAISDALAPDANGDPLK